MSVALVATGGMLLGSSPAAHADTSPGQGSSYAQGLAVAPHDGSLAVGVTLAEAIAGHTNGIAKAQSQGIDLGAIGTSLTGYNCGSNPTFKPDQIPQALETETGSPGADPGISQQPDPTAGPSQPSFGTYEFVKATAAPYGEADTSLPPVTSPVFRVDSMVTKAWSGLVNGARVAGATSTIGGVDIANGMVDLSNLRWESQYPSGGSGTPSGSFTIGQVKIQGVPIPAGPDLSAVQNAINTVLGNIGLEVQLPVSSVTQGVQSVSPLEILVVANDNRDNAINPALNATLPVQQTLFDGLENGFSPAEPAQLAQALCNSDTPITVAQIALASVNGGGFFSAALGGVNSSSSDVAANPFNLSGFSGSLGGDLGGGTLGSTVASGSGSAGVSSLGASSSPTSGSPTLAPTAGTAGSSGGGTSGQPGASPGTAAISPASTSYAAGGPLLAIGLAGLALLGLLAEIDRRMMRRAQQTVQFEE